MQIFKVWFSGDRQSRVLELYVPRYIAAAIVRIIKMASHTADFMPRKFVLNVAVKSARSSAMKIANGFKSA